MTFVSKEIRVQGDGRIHVIGDLTIRGTTRSVTLDANPISDEKTP
jgi:polyisoprenoid-binding protein YceI